MMNEINSQSNKLASYAILLIWRYKMLRIIGEEWLIDTEALLCRNNYTEIVVKFEKRGEAYIGRIKDMPLDLTIRLAKMKDGDKLLQKAVMDAEEIFNKEMCEKLEERKTS